MDTKTTKDFINDQQYGKKSKVKKKSSKVSQRTRLSPTLKKMKK